ncbi:metal ABC transporter ATP-binding protein [Acidiphilium sp.]|uniref:metal ABC transporter ATP-binding protein n=1 Tax=Acidiphilium sp. TaxID=527 RepID=UPI0025849730|nr:ABC transporter ATP-binding protein [Acidiphilium sp.]
MSGDALALEGVAVGHGGRAVLSGVGFSLAPGSFAGLIGPNGSGKTTLLRSILGLVPLLGGRVAIGGRGQVGYVPQSIALDRFMPVRARDVIALGLDGHRLGIPLPSRRRRALVDEMIDAVGATGFADRRVGDLSGGQQQRVMIAHALIRRPDVLLLDEPLASLDLRSTAEVVSLLARLAREAKVAVLMSAHDMNPLLPAMDRIVYVAEGRAVAGTVAEVVRGAVLSALYGAHIDVLRVHGRVLVVAAGGGPHDHDHDHAHGEDAMHVVRIP